MRRAKDLSVGGRRPAAEAGTRGARCGPRLAPCLLLAFLALALAPALGGCAGAARQGPAVPGGEDPVGEAGPVAVPLSMPEIYRICRGDVLEVVGYYGETIQRTHAQVRPDGRITLPGVDEVVAAGLTTEELSAVLHQEYSAYYRDPQVSVLLAHSPSSLVFVGGEVNIGGVVPLRRTLTAYEAIAQSGGFTHNAKTSEVLILRKLSPTEAQILEIDLSGPRKIRDAEENVYLQPGDLVLVPMNGISRTRLWVNQYLMRTLALELITEFQFYFNVLRFN